MFQFRHCHCTGPAGCSGGGVACGAFAFQFNNTPPTCGGDDGIVRFDNVTYNGTTPPVRYRIRQVGDAVYIEQPNNPIFIGRSAGDYEYIVENLNNNDVCAGTFSLRPETSVNASALDFEDAKCFGQADGRARVNATGSATGNYYYSIDNGLTWTLFTPGNMISGLAPDGTYNILVGESTTDNCPAEVSVTINNKYPQISVAAFTTVTPASCDNDDGEVEVGTISGGSGSYTFELDGQPYSMPSDNIITGLARGAHALKVFDGEGCGQSFTFNVQSPGLVVYNWSSFAATCSGNGKDGRLYISDIQGQAPFYYSLDGSDFVEISNNSFYINNLTPGSYEFVIKSGSPEDGCPNSTLMYVGGLGHFEL